MVTRPKYVGKVSTQEAIHGIEVGTTCMTGTMKRRRNEDSEVINGVYMNADAKCLVYARPQDRRMAVKMQIPICTSLRYVHAFPSILPMI